MKFAGLTIVISIALFLYFNNSQTKPMLKNKYTPTISTSVGDIAYYEKEVKGTVPIIFLHGVYYDHNLWNYQIDRISDQTVITIDMPLHGKSKNISKKDWDMADCSHMLIEILDKLQIEKCYAIGHSWGSMTILRAASQHPERFVGVGFCNMPLDEGSVGSKLLFGFQHLALGFRGFYTKQVTKAMFDKEIITQKPEIAEYLEISMSQLSNQDIRITDKAVITKVNSGHPFLEKLTVKALALKGDNDYVPTLQNIKTTIVKGKHTSPLEQPDEVLKMIKEVLSN